MFSLLIRDHLSIKFVLKANELLLWECGSKFLSKLRNMSHISSKIKQREDDVLFRLQDINFSLKVKKS